MEDKRKKHKYKRVFLICAALLLIAVSLTVVIRSSLKKEKSEPKSESQVKQNVVKPGSEEPPEEKPKVVNPIDFPTLQAANPDIYAWLRIPGMSIDFPVLQSTSEDSFYLNHDAGGQPSASGSIYTERYNSKDFGNPNTVIYGHNMQDADRIMFATLLDYSDRTFFDGHREVIIYLPDRILHYNVFAAYETDDKHILLSYDFHNPEIYQGYLNEVLGNPDPAANIATDSTVTISNQLVTLSTCVNGDRPDRRFVVQAVLVNQEFVS